MSELTAKENIKTADTVKRITATAVMAALTTLMTAYIFHIAKRILLNLNIISIQSIQKTHLQLLSL